MQNEHRAWVLAIWPLSIQSIELIRSEFEPSLKVILLSIQSGWQRICSLVEWKAFMPSNCIAIRICSLAEWKEGAFAPNWIPIPTFIASRKAFLLNKTPRTILQGFFNFGGRQLTWSGEPFRFKYISIRRRRPARAPFPFGYVSVQWRRRSHSISNTYLYVESLFTARLQVQPIVTCMQIPRRTRERGRLNNYDNRKKDRLNNPWQQRTRGLNKSVTTHSI